MSGGKREYKDARNKKREDIQRSLAHRSNLKRKYFKLLEKQGEQVPDKPSTEHNPKVSRILFYVEGEKVLISSQSHTAKGQTQ